MKKILLILKKNIMKKKMINIKINKNIEKEKLNSDKKNRVHLNIQLMNIVHTLHQTIILMK